MKSDVNTLLVSHSTVRKQKILRNDVIISPPQGETYGECSEDVYVLCTFNLPPVFRGLEHCLR